MSEPTEQSGPDALAPEALASLVERTIAVPSPLLFFPKPLEKRLEADTRTRRTERMAVNILVGLGIFNLFLIVDWWLMPDTFGLALVLRALIVTPLGLVILLLMLSWPIAPVRELGQVVLGIGAMLVPPVLVVLSDSPLAAAHHHGLVLFVLYLTIVQRLGFWFLLPSVLVMNVIYAITLALSPETPLPETLSYMVVFASVSLFSLIAAYLLEREWRTNYLMTLREHLRNEALEEMSLRDPLTGLRNRRALDRCFARHLARAGTEPGRLLAVVLLDIDHFKAFNDAAGHAAGDECLRRIARLVNACVPQGDHQAFRFGGEEFIVVLDGFDQSSARIVAETMRRALEDEAIEHPARAMRGFVTASFGIASCPLEPLSDVNELVLAADAALYAAKRDGRNRVWPPAKGSAGGTRKSRAAVMPRRAV